MAKRRAGFLEATSWIVGLGLLVFVAAAFVDRWAASTSSIDAFRDAQREARAAGPLAPAHAAGPAEALVPSGEEPETPAGGIGRSAGAGSTATASSGGLDPMPPVDTSLWDAKRISGYEESLKVDKRPPEALLHIPDIDLTVAVLNGVDEVTLNRGVGRIPGTARIGGPGNLGIAGHRDGFFRGLKDIGPGSRMELETLNGTQNYTVSDIWIVKPADVHVLQPTEEPSITLVTCYPFYFVGNAPERYIVRATLDEAD